MEHYVTYMLLRILVVNDAKLTHFFVFLAVCHINVEQVYTLTNGIAF